MTNIAVPSKVNFDEVEKILHTLNGSDLKKPIDLELPAKITFDGFGIEVAMLQAIFKWIRSYPGKLKLRFTDRDLKVIEDFATSFFAYILLSTIWKKVDIIDSNGINLKPQLREYTEGMNRRLDFLKDLPNDEVYLTCFDHYSKEKGLPHWLYPTHEYFVQSPSGLENTIYLVLQSVGKIYKTRFNAVLSKITEELDQIIWELLKNTDEHARTNLSNSVILSPNTRGVGIKLIRDTKESILKKADGHTGLVNYYNNVAEDQAFFLEISVFDSGPGLVKRFMGKHWTPEVKIVDEVNAVKECLRKGSTSVDDWKGSQKGFGLNEVLVMLSKLRGFIKIRTNRCSLYRNLAQYPIVPANGNMDTVANNKDSN